MESEEEGDSGAVDKEAQVARQRDQTFRIGTYQRLDTVGGPVTGTLGSDEGG